jgi:protein-S-isoprenylcysteine O-methyltransferase Ste14
MIRFFERGEAWVAGQFLLFAPVILLAIRYPGTGPLVGRFAGVFLLVVAASVAAAGAITLGKNLTPLPEPAAHAQLVQHGIYARIRHPIYASAILAGFGWALAWLSWPSAVAAAVLVPFLHAKSRREEHLLRRRFPGYREYEARTRRFIPWIC